MNISLKTMLVLVSFFAAGVLVWLRFQPMDHFEIALSGPVVSKFEQGSRLVITHPGQEPTVCKIIDLPLRLPKEGYQDKNLRVYLLGPKSPDPLCSVDLSRSLFDKPRRINICLDCPNSIVRPFIDDWRNPRFSAKLSQRMEYHDLPYLDPVSGKLGPCPSPPWIKVVNTSTGDTLLNEPMSPGCWDSRWFSRIPSDLGLSDNNELEFTATYDSGGLFVNPGATLNFTFHESLHQ